VVVVSDHETRGALAAAAFACGNQLSVSSVSTPDRLESLIDAGQIKAPCLVLVTDVEFIGFLKRMEALADSPVVLLVPEGSREGSSECGTCAGADFVAPVQDALSEGGCQRLMSQVQNCFMASEELQQRSRAA
jgi:hypothetical protein